MNAIEPVIPFCRSEFLQDFTIELGLRGNPHKRWPLFTAEVDVCDLEDGPLERLSIWIDTYYFTRVYFGLWEDRTVWLSVALLPTKNHDGYEVGFHPDTQTLSFGNMIDALDSSVSASTRLCYHECPLPLLRKFWRHEGDVEITGKLARSKA